MPTGLAPVCLQVKQHEGKQAAGKARKPGLLLSWGLFSLELCPHCHLCPLTAATRCCQKPKLACSPIWSREKLSRPSFSPLVTKLKLSQTKRREVRLQHLSSESWNYHNVPILTSTLLFPCWLRGPIRQWTPILSSKWCEPGPRVHFRLWGLHWPWQTWQDPPISHRCWCGQQRLVSGEWAYRQWVSLPSLASGKDSWSSGRASREWSEPNLSSELLCARYRWGRMTSITPSQGLGPAGQALHPWSISTA